MSFPYYSEPTHDTGVITDAASNKARSTAESSAESRLVVDAVDK